MRNSFAVSTATVRKCDSAASILQFSYIIYPQITRNKLLQKWHVVAGWALSTIFRANNAINSAITSNECEYILIVLAIVLILHNKVFLIHTNCKWSRSYSLRHKQFSAIIYLRIQSVQSLKVIPRPYFTLCKYRPVLVLPTIKFSNCFVQNLLPYRAINLHNSCWKKPNSYNIWAYL